MSHERTADALAEDFVTFDQFILLGDSITQNASNHEGGFGFVPALAHDYARRLDVINRGFSGYNTANIRLIYPRFFPPPHIARVRFLLLFFGANDSVIDRTSRHHVSVDEYKANLEYIITHPSTRQQNPNIIVVTPPPICEHQQKQLDIQKGFPFLRRRAENTKKYAEACLDVASRMNVVGVDIWSAFMREAGWEQGRALKGSLEVQKNEVLQSLLYDGLHLSADGYRLLYREVRDVIHQSFPNQTPEKLPMVFAGWQNAPRYDD
ncbi:GDSL Lipase/Acylhydrolase family protein [Talaromyces proteolyticus]|uniref:GDSL Lipase/Acylhydrolase family protein n=1 Tax=Talaromyces proteolyticus TaxID=1131652 RepID=A0AAD4Q2K1_9EURO|nr:GDSL Lipase/Acylhydrolase family protein [Talaromyces proteolyticus]KAH8703772.1 GDSL Lipase/Acylhydrolase family protein [Talaromyces proteolyticus]